MPTRTSRPAGEFPSFFDQPAALSALLLQPEIKPKKNCACLKFQGLRVALIHVADYDGTYGTMHGRHVESRRPVARQVESVNSGVVDPTITCLFDKYHQLTGDVRAAARLVQAQLQALKPPPHTIPLGQMLTPPQVARALRVDPTTVISWIRSAELPAANVGKGKSRPRFRIRPADLERFLAARQPNATAPKSRRRKPQASETQFF